MRIYIGIRLHRSPEDGNLSMQQDKHDYAVVVYRLFEADLEVCRHVSRVLT